MLVEFRKHPEHPESILFRKFFGYVGIDEIIASWDSLVKSDLLQATTKGVITDLTECSLKMAPSSINYLIEYMERKVVLHGLKIAVISDSPENIVFPILGESLGVKIKIKPFSTSDAAVKWILQD